MSDSTNNDRDFPGYELLSELGKGGMGIVFKAREIENDRIVAIKQLILENVDASKISEFKNRFRREASTASRLIHENIVEVFEISTDPDRYYYVMEFLEGMSLRQLMSRKRGGFDIAEFWPVLRQLGRGLSYAHSMNVIHRDVKPDNVFILNDGHVKITDFGIARVADLEDTSLTKSGVMLGTLSYVSPEQLENAKTVDHRADIFSLGVVSYEALCGKLPFVGDGIAGTIVKIMSQEETPLHTQKIGIPPEVSSAVSRALRKKPRDRYRSVQDFLRDFEQALSIHQDSRENRKNIENFIFDNNSTAVDIPMESLLTESISNQLDNSCESEALLANLAEKKDVDSNEEISLIDEDTKNRALGSQQTVAGGYRAIPEHLRSTGEFSATVSLDKEGVLRNNRTDKARAKQQISSSSALRPFNTSKIDVSRRAAQPNQENKSYTGAPVYNPIRLLSTIDRQGKDNRALVEPTAISYRSGRLVIADTGTRDVHVFSKEGRWLFDLATRPEITGSKTSGGRLTKPSGIAFDERGRVFVCDSSDHYIRLFDSQGVFMKEFKNIQGTDGGLQGIAIDSAGLLYVSDSSNNCLQVFQSDMGVWMRSLATSPEKVGMLRLPSGLATDKLNRIYAVDYGACSVLIFNKSGNLVRSFGGKGTDKGQFNIPRAVAVDRQDRIFVIDSLNHRIQVFGSAGDWLYTYGSLGAGADQFRGPAGIALDHENNHLYVADRGNKRVQIFELGFK